MANLKIVAGPPRTNAITFKFGPVIKPILSHTPSKMHNYKLNISAANNLNMLKIGVLSKKKWHPLELKF
jgi:hypothetical protein